MCRALRSAARVEGVLVEALGVSVFERDEDAGVHLAVIPHLPVCS